MPLRIDWRNRFGELLREARNGRQRAPAAKTGGCN
jgi:hypothetical protein